MSKTEKLAEGSAEEVMQQPSWALNEAGGPPNSQRQPMWPTGKEDKEAAKAATHDAVAPADCVLKFESIGGRAKQWPDRLRESKAKQRPDRLEESVDAEEKESSQGKSSEGTQEENTEGAKEAALQVSNTRDDMDWKSIEAGGDPVQGRVRSAERSVQPPNAIGGRWKLTGDTITGPMPFGAGQAVCEGLLVVYVRGEGSGTSSPQSRDYSTTMQAEAKMVSGQLSAEVGHREGGNKKERAEGTQKESSREERDKGIRKARLMPWSPCQEADCCQIQPPDSLTFARGNRKRVRREERPYFKCNKVEFPHWFNSKNLGCEVRCCNCLWWQTAVRSVKCREPITYVDTTDILHGNATCNHQLCLQCFARDERCTRHSHMRIVDAPAASHNSTRISEGREDEEEDRNANNPCTGIEDPDLQRLKINQISVPEEKVEKAMGAP